jgi:class 3 adenylate cyclase
VQEAVPPPFEPVASEPAREEVAPASDDELRPVTALFADVVGSTALGERLQPDEVKALIGECINRIARTVEQFGGTIHAYMGDGIAAFFGLPAAHEDDPERAAQAGLRILEVVRGYATDIATAWGVENFDVRVGINSGQTAVGSIGAADRQQIALGDTTNVASRLESVAAPGTIVVGGTTARLLAHRFVLESLGDVQVKGRDQAVAAWRLVGIHDEAETRGPTPTLLVDREEEVARLREAARELTEGGRGQLLLLVGESGIGKTRMLTELRTIVGDRATALEGQCRSYGAELLYGPFVEALRRWLGVEPGEAEVSVRTKLRARVMSLPLPDAAATARSLARLLSVTADGNGAQPDHEPTPEELGRDICRAYSGWIEALCKERPVVFSIDDMHWADPSTRELAQTLLDLTDRAPLLLAMALRGDVASEGSHFRLHALENYAHRTVELPLRPLSVEAAGELLAMLMPDGLDERARRELVARAEGNPLFLEELMHSLIENGGLARKQMTWALTTIGPLIVPPALEGLLISRIDSLPDGARRLAQVAAVIGRVFPARVLECACTSEDFERDIAVLLRSQHIRELRRDPELVYTFKHGLLQEAALSTLTSARRRELYGTVAAAVETVEVSSRNDHLEELAYYYAQSNELPKAIAYLEEAGSRAASLNARQQAGELWRRAQKMAAKAGDTAAEQRLAGRLESLS